MPRPTSGRANVAWSAATRKSQASEISNPPPKARPLMAATVGICSRARLSAKEFRARLCAHLSSASIARRSFRSAPEQNAFSPAPVNMSALTSPAPSISTSARELLDDSDAKCVGAIGPVERYRRHPVLDRDLYLLEFTKHFAPPQTRRPGTRLQFSITPGSRTNRSNFPQSP